MVVGLHNFLIYAVTAAITKTGILKPVMDKINQPTNVNSDMSQTTGIPFWGLVVILTIITIFTSIRTLNNKKVRVAVPKLKQRYTGIKYTFRKTIPSIYCSNCNWTYRTLSLANECINWKK